MRLHRTQLRALHILGHWSWCCTCASRSHVLDHSVRRCIGSGRRVFGGETCGAAGAGTLYSTTGAGATLDATGAGATKDTAGAGAMYSTTGARWSWCCAGASRSHVFDHCVKRCTRRARLPPPLAPDPGVLFFMVGESWRKSLRHWSRSCALSKCARKTRKSAN